MIKWYQWLLVILLYITPVPGTLTLYLIWLAYRNPEKRTRLLMLFKSLKLYLSEKEDRTAEPDWETWANWYELINMSKSELNNFMDTQRGEKAGLSRSEADKKGIDSGQESAEMLVKMIPDGQSWESAKKNWTTSMWFWAGKQNSFISRMRGVDGDLYDEDGEMTRKHTSLKIWGHDPEKDLNKRPNKPENV